MLRKLIAVAAVSLCATTAYPDGMPIVTSSLLGHLSEQVQAAVVTVNPDHTANVDLFISLSSSSPKPLEIHFLLPLQSLPKQFAAQEMPYRQFSEKSLWPLEALLLSAHGRAGRARRAISATYVRSSLLSGPLSLLPALWLTEYSPRFGGVATAQGEAAPAPALSVATAHTKADIYPSLQPDQLAALAKLPELADVTRKTLRQYAGRPFALVTLRLIPSPNAARGPVSPYPHTDTPPGVLFSFAQTMKAEDGGAVYRYDFPLGTGQAWSQPIPSTAIYVTAPEDLNLAVLFPDRPLVPKQPEDGPHSPLGYASAGAENGRQVHMATYLNSPFFGSAPKQTNPSEDIEIRLRSSGRSELVVQRDATRRRTLALCLASPLLALLSWSLAWLLFLRRGLGERPAGRWNGFARSWVLTQALLLPFVLVFLLLRSASYHYAVYGLPQFDWFERSWLYWTIEDAQTRERVFYGVPSVLLALLGVFLLWRITRKFHPAAPLLWRLPLAALLSGAIYVTGGYLLGLL